MVLFWLASRFTIAVRLPLLILNIDAGLVKVIPLLEGINFLILFILGVPLRLLGLPAIFSPLLPVPIPLATIPTILLIELYFVGLHLYYFGHLFINHIPEALDYQQMIVALVFGDWLFRVRGIGGQLLDLCLLLFQFLQHLLLTDLVHLYLILQQDYLLGIYFVLLFKLSQFTLLYLLIFFQLLNVLLEFKKKTAFVCYYVVWRRRRRVRGLFERFLGFLGLEGLELILFFGYTVISLSQINLGTSASLLFMFRIYHVGQDIIFSNFSMELTTILIESTLIQPRCLALASIKQHLGYITDITLFHQCLSAIIAHPQKLTPTIAISINIAMFLNILGILIGSNTRIVIIVVVLLL